MNLSIRKVTGGYHVEAVDDGLPPGMVERARRGSTDGYSMTVGTSHELVCGEGDGELIKTIQAALVLCQVVK